MVTVHRKSRKEPKLTRRNPKPPLRAVPSGTSDLPQPAHNVRHNNRTDESLRVSGVWEITPQSESESTLGSGPIIWGERPL